MAFWQRLLQKHAGMTPRPTLSAADRRQRLTAIGLMALATLCFAVLDSSAKYLVVTERVPVALVTWLRFVGHVVFSAVVLWPFALRPSLRSAKPWVQIFRSALMVVTTGFNFIALRYLQLDQTVTIFFLTPLLVAALAGPLLNEWVGWHRMLAIIAGFFGVLLVMLLGALITVLTGITEVLPQYSGGLGILAGDHLKAASDLGVPIIGVGLLYRQGYFVQTIDADGRLFVADRTSRRVQIFDGEGTYLASIGDEKGNPAIFPAGAARQRRARP